MSCITRLGHVALEALVVAQQLGALFGAAPERGVELVHVVLGHLRGPGGGWEEDESQGLGAGRGGPGARQNAKQQRPRAALLEHALPPSTAAPPPTFANMAR